MKVAVTLPKNIFAPLGVTAAASATDAGIQKKTSNVNNFKRGNKWYITKIVQALEDSNILFKGVTEAIKNKTKEQKGGFFGMLLGILGASLFGTMLEL